MTLNFRRVFVWHMSNARWERAFDKYETLVDSIKNVHQKFLKKRYNKSVSKHKNRPGFIGVWWIN